MNRFAVAAVVALAGCVRLAAPACAEITSIGGSASASLTEFLNGSTADSDSAADSFPGTSELPLQVVARLISPDGNEPAAAVVGAQFADPRESAQPNPEEFAINLALNSESPAIRYEARASSQELRGVLFSPGELGAQFGEGDEVALTGALFLDGALTIVAFGESDDLTGAEVVLTVTVEKLVDGAAAEQVFSGQVSLTGAVSAGVDVAAEGDFPLRQLILTDLAGLIDEATAFRLLIIPNIEIAYDYNAVVGEAFTLRATVTVDAANAPGQVAVAAVLGTPTDSIQTVLDLTQGDVTAAKVLDALRRERDDPTGEPAFEDAQPLRGPCGLFGLELALGVVGLSALRRKYAVQRSG